MSTYEALGPFGYFYGASSPRLRADLLALRR